MSKIRLIPARIRALLSLPGQVEQLQASIMDINHQMAELMKLNHDVRTSSVEHLPLFLGVTEQMRTDADASIAATKVLERQLDILERRLEELSDSGVLKRDPR